MQTNPPVQAIWEALLINIILTVIFLFQAVVNFHKRKLSKFSIDALGLFLATTLFGGKIRQRALALRNDSKRIFIWGVLAILGAISSIYEIVILVKSLSND